MKLIELIDHLKTTSKAEQLISQLIPGVEFDLVEVFMIDHLSFESEIAFFNAEAVSDTIIIEIDGIKYENFFPLYLIQEMVEEYVEKYHNKLSNSDIGKRILEYRHTDY